MNEKNLVDDALAKVMDLGTIGAMRWLARQCADEYATLKKTMVPLSADGQSVFIEGEGAVALCRRRDEVPESSPKRAEPEFCGRPGTGECSCAKFGADPTRCENLLEWKRERASDASAK